VKQFLRMGAITTSWQILLLENLKKSTRRLDVGKRDSEESKFSTLFVALLLRYFDICFMTYNCFLQIRKSIQYSEDGVERNAEHDVNRIPSLDEKTQLSYGLFKLGDRKL